MDEEAGASRVEPLLRDLAPRVLGAVARRYDDFHAAEDAVQETLIAAGRQWPGEGVPANLAGWLYQVALRRLTDRARSETASLEETDWPQVLALYGVLMRMGDNRMVALNHAVGRT